MKLYDFTSLVERAHRAHLDAVKTELGAMHVFDINNVQAMILFNIGDEDMAMGKLTTRGMYLGANVSYNMSRMAEAGYLDTERGERDKRAVRVRASAKGRELQARLAEMFDRHIGRLEQLGVCEPELTALGETLQQIDQFFTKTVERGVSVGHLS